MAALRDSYFGLVAGESAYAPRIDLLGPVEPPMGAYRWGSMSGICLRAGVVAVRIKSDVVGWDSEGVESKFCVRPGLYSGVVIVYSVSDGRPLALLQDGIIQHVRLGAAIGLGIGALFGPEAVSDEISPVASGSRPTPLVVGLVGSGGMAWSSLEAVISVLPVERVRVFSPTARNREAFAHRVTEQFEIPAEPLPHAHEVVAGAQVVISATSSTSATLETDWLDDDAVVAFVSRREVPADLHEKVKHVYRLGEASLGPDTEYPGLESYRGGYAGIAVGGQDFRSSLPRRRGGESGLPEQDLPGLLAGMTSPRQHERAALIAVGTQGLQFAAVAGYAVRRAEETGVGHVLPDDWFLQDIRD